MFQHKLTVGVAALVFAGAYSYAGITTDIAASLNKSASSLDGYTTTSLVVSTSVDWNKTQVLMVLTSGSIYNSATGTTYQAPTSGSDLLNDTYITDKSGASLVVVSGAQTIGGGSSPVWSSTTIDIAASNLTSGDTGTFTNAQFTLTNDAQGTFIFYVGNKGVQVGGIFKGDYVQLQGSIVNGQFVLATVPEPASIGMLALAAGLLLKRRK